MSYEKAMKHVRSHRKDRFLQQCSGPVNYEASNVSAKEQNRRAENLEKSSFRKIALLVEEGKLLFPFRLEIHGPYYCATDNLQGLDFPYVLHSVEELERYQKEYL